MFPIALSKTPSRLNCFGRPTVSSVIMNGFQTTCAKERGMHRKLAPSKPVPNPLSLSNAVILNGLTTVRQLLLFSAARSGCQGRMPAVRKRDVHALGTVDYLIRGSN